MFNPINYYSTNAPAVSGKTSMIKRIAAITFIFLCTSVAWAILGATIFERTYDSGSSSDSRVASTWGAPQNQLPPTAAFEDVVQTKEERTENGKKTETVIQQKVVKPAPLESSHLNVDLNLEHRQKGLLWYSTYKVAFDGAYAFHNPTDKEQNVTFALAFPTAQAIYDDLVFTVDDVPLTLSNGKNSASGTAKIAAGKTAVLKVGYKSQGLNDWRYSFGSATPRITSGNGEPNATDVDDFARTTPNVAQVRDFSMKMTTNFKDVDVPDTTLSPTLKTETAKGWNLEWPYKILVSGKSMSLKFVVVFIEKSRT